jgi:hypothetical protein
LGLWHGYLGGIEQGVFPAMTTFDKREQAAEGKFALDEQSHFKALARRDKLVGLWAAEKLGLNGADADAYAKSLILADLEEPGDEDVVRKLVADFAAKKVAVTDAEIRSQLAEKLVTATAQIQAQG